MKHDTGTTLTGAAAALTLLATVDWAQVPQGQLMKVFVAFGLLLAGYFMYRNKPAQQEDPPVALVVKKEMTISEAPVVEAK